MVNARLIDWLPSIVSEAFRAFGSVGAKICGKAAWASLYRTQGFPTLEEFLVGVSESYILTRDANNLLAQLWTWQKADISDNEIYRSNLAIAFGAIKAKGLIMPSETDRYFVVEDNMPHLRQAELGPIPSIMGHMAGGSFSASLQDAAFLAKGVRDLLSA